MSKLDTVVGIDIGTSGTRTIIAQKPENENEAPQIIGVGEASSSGIRKGMVVDIGETVNSINESVEQAERMAGVPVEHAHVSLGNSDVTYQFSKGAIAMGKPDGEVTEGDVERAINAAQTISVPNNKEIIHVIPQKFSLDNQDEIKDPVGMSGVRLEANCMVIESPSSCLKNIDKCLYQAGISLEELVLSALAAQMATLTKRQKELGVVLINIGGGTTSLAVYEDGELLHVGVVPIGGGNITNDIAIGLRTSIEVAEDVKIKYGSCLPAEINKKEQIDLSKFDKNEESVVSRRHVAEIIEARIEEIFELVNKELKSIDRDGMLPAGAVIVGGSSRTIGCVDLGKKILKLPTQNGFPNKELGGMADKVDEPGFITAIGLIYWGLENKVESSSINGIKKVFSKPVSVASKMYKWLKTFLP